VEFILIVKGSVRQFLRFVGIDSQSLDETEAKVEVPK